MPQEKKRYKAIIANKTYTIIGHESKEHMDLVADLANEQLQEILKLSPQTTLEQGSVLLAINALSDQIKKQAEILALEDKVAAMTDQVARVAELETRLERVQNLEDRARQLLRENGQETKEELNPIEAQQIINQQVKARIQQNHQEKNKEA